MARADSKKRPRKFHEWKKGIISNTGVTATFPYDITFNYISNKNLLQIIELFFEDHIEKIDLLDQCVLEQFWWIKHNLVAARYAKIDHPNYYSGEYIFDEENGRRTIIEVRQPDIDGKHWKAEHIHIKRGMIDPDNLSGLLRVNYNEHIELTYTPINGVYIMKIEE